MGQTFQCPNCGASLDYNPGDDPVIQCGYCRTSVVVPEGILRASIRAADEAVLVSTTRVEYPRADEEGQSISLRMDLLDAPIQVETATEGVSPSVVKTTAGFIGGVSCLSLAVAIGVFALILVVTLIGLASPGGPLEGVWNRTNPFAYAQVALAFGAEGSGPGLFDDPRAITITPAGDIYVGEYSDGRVQRFDANGAYQMLWNIGAEQYLQDIASDPAGGVYLLARGEIRKYDGNTGQLLGVITHPEGRWIEALAVGADGSIVAAVNSEDILRYDPSGQLVFSMKQAGLNQSGKPESAYSLAVDGVGNIYLLSMDDAIIRYAPDGRLLGRFGSSGDEPGQLRAPSAIAVDGQGRIYVSDITGIQVFASDGRYQDKIEVEGYAFGLAFDQQGNLWTVTNLPRVFKYQIAAR